MAKAFFNSLSRNETSATSAGTKPSSQVNPIVVEAMFEVGIDIRNQVPKALTLEMLKSADRVITMGCGVEEVYPTSFIPTEDYTIVIVTHNMQQAARVSDMAAFLMMEEDRAGVLVEYGPTSQLFTNPRDKRTEDYITGRFG